MSAWPNTSSNPDALDRRVRDGFVLGPERTRQEDIALCLQQIVDLAPRALSPASNDPTTAFTCIDRLAQILVYRGRRARAEDAMLGAISVEGFVDRELNTRRRRELRSVRSARRHWASSGCLPPHYALGHIAHRVPIDCWPTLWKWQVSSGTLRSHKRRARTRQRGCTAPLAGATASLTLIGKQTQ